MSRGLRARHSSWPSPMPLHHAGPVVLDEHVARARASSKQRARTAAAWTRSRLMLRLPGVLLHEVRRQPVDPRVGEAGQVALGRLDLDHVGAEIGTASACSAGPLSTRVKSSTRTPSSGRWVMRPG